MRLRLLGLVLAAAAVALGSCGGSDDESTGGGALTLAIPSTVSSLDPNSVNGYGAALWPLMYDPLVHVDAQGKIQSGLAESWTANKAGTRYDFTLRDDAACANSGKVTPSLVARNFEHLKDPEANLPAAPTYLNTTEYEVSADDQASRFTLTLKNPNPFLLEGLARIYIVCERGLKDPKAFDTGDGSGPYKMVEAQTGERWVFEPRPEYSWGPGGASMDADGVPGRVIVRVVSEETTAANLLQAGDLDVATFAGPEHARVEGANGVSAKRVNAANSLLVFNQNSGHATADRVVRRALIAAIDREQFVQVLTGGLGSVPTALATTAPVACKYDVTAALPAFDVEAAKQELDAAGWTAGSDGIRRKGGRELVVKLTGDTETRSAFELLQQSWSEIGVRAELELVGGSAQLQEKIFGGDDWDAVLVTLEGSVPTVYMPFLTGPAPAEGQNFGHVDNPQYTKLGTQALSATREQACGLWEAAERAEYESADMVPLSQLVTLWAYGDDVSIEPRATIDYISTSLRKR